MPRAYIPVDVVNRVHEAAGNRCGYCLTSKRYMPVPFHIEHIIPIARGGSDDESNLWLACPLCNGHKSDKINGLDPQTGEKCSLFNPRTQRWAEHFRWDDDPVYIVGLTAIGRVTVIELKLNDLDALEARRNWVSVGWHPPKD